MGNNIVIGGGNKGSKSSAKIMKLNGEYFRVKIPTNVIDITKDYPDHILLDSDDFIRYNLRAKPLDLDFQLKPRKIYLLFELPKFPGNNNIFSPNNAGNINSNKSPLRRVRSGVLETTVTTSKKLRMMMMMSKRSVSDLSITTKSTVVVDSDDGGPTRVKLRLPKAKVQRIIKESNDDVEERILRLFAAVEGGDAVVDVEEGSGGRGEESGSMVVVEEVEEDEVEVEVVDKRCFNILHAVYGSPHRRKYMKLVS